MPWLSKHPSISEDCGISLCGQFSLYRIRSAVDEKAHTGMAIPVASSASVDDVFQLCSRFARQFTFHYDRLSVGEKVL